MIMWKMMMLVVVIIFAFAAEFIDHGDIVQYKRWREDANVRGMALVKPCNFFFWLKYF